MNGVRCLATPKEGGGLKERNVAVFRIKVNFSRRKSATKLFVKTFSDKVVRHSLAYLTVHKWLVGDVPSFYLKFSAKLTHPLQKRRLFQSIFAHSTSPATPSEKGLTRKCRNCAALQLKVRPTGDQSFSALNTTSENGTTAILEFHFHFRF